MAAAAPARARRRRRRYDDVRNRILDAAVHLFAQHGIVNTRVESITEMADVAKGTFFNYFPSKEAIAGEIARRLITDLWIVAQRARTAGSMRPVLAALPEVLLDTMRGSPVLCRSLLGALLLHESVAADFLEIQTSVRTHLAYILERGQEIGEIRTDRAAADLAQGLQEALWGAMIFWRDGADMHHKMNTAVDIFWNGAAVAAPDGPEWGV